MAETIKVACPGCDAIFEIPIELGGELGECTECDVVFEIPKLTSSRKQEEIKPIIPQMTDEDIEATGTVKLSRSSIGMIPELKDAFDFGVTDDDSALSAAGLSDIISNAAPAAKPAPAPAPEPEPVIEEPPKPRHGGLKIAGKSPTAPEPKPEPEPEPAQTSPRNIPASQPAPANKAKENNATDMDSIVIIENEFSQKSQVITLVLCLFLGWSGAHRFYVGKIITAVGMLLTFGGFGVWWFIDLIMIVTDKFNDASNQPLK